MGKLPTFSRSPSPAYGRRPATVLSHRILRSLLYFLAWIFLLLVCIANTSNKPVLRNTYFLKIDLSNIIPLSVPNAVLINSIARSIGLHDFYQVGLWNFCEGYNSEGITHCSSPQTLYWFNPVEIILSELLAGASIALPADISDALQIARIASYWMFGLFITATVLTFVLIFLSPLAVSSRPPQSISPSAETNAAHPPHRRRTFVLLRSSPFLLLTFITALFTIVASVVATVMFLIFRNVFTDSSYELNIEAEIGTRMLAFMWIASALNLIAFIWQSGSCCAACCGGRKARKQLKEHGSSESSGSNGSDMREKPQSHHQSPTGTTPTGNE
ncbi:SUR7/PalI family protein [Aspergillus candidus]|uniref:SUR7/PalI family-domain-containing protein n=1 Tax=Aspergillus candidus TaxID=41067 RepID=A0A2I2F5N5_ASPCN|nr:SUR7/PalI family-domain-containing protein [Aspergillus candidus]PLB35876.1 SUR7/PalI family-domain-containing protein [Aspergillus candidus]